MLFSLINYARFLNVNPDNALAKTNTKFINRFKFIEAQAKEQGKAIHDLNLAEMNEFWEMAKEK